MLRLRWSRRCKRTSTQNVDVDDGRWFDNQVIRLKISFSDWSQRKDDGISLGTSDIGLTLYVPTSTSK
ncbi:hypothetical protein ASE90_06100 [Sphingomonas sp. Leaf67]|nr:hypothetical protein ASE90_06100 [Sphingomonas sp. Leaf67]